MTLGFIAAFIGIFVGLVAVVVLIGWLMHSEYGEIIIGLLVFLGVLVGLAWAAWEITTALISKG